ncbi:hypothetical protein F5X99DRAFT_418300 [Biscogniauxia marginata]|nr:hypothetical protein F5X99DRAFT_418300 [Biscogniauxia marginata]
MDKASELHDGLIDELKSIVSDGDFMTQCIFQPLPILFSEHSVKAGDNVMGIERNKSNGIIFQMTVMVKGLIAAVKDYAETIEGNLEWLYMKYASEADNVKKMKDVAIKYDPQQVFQKLCPGGWKISDVE